MPYRSRHFPRVTASKAIVKFGREAFEEFSKTRLYVDKDDEALLQDLARRSRKRGSSSGSQANRELWDDIQARMEDRVDTRCRPLARELEGYFDHLHLPPFPAPLPKSSHWLQIRRPDFHKPRDTRPFYVACGEGCLDEVKNWIEEKKDIRAMTLRDGLDCAAIGNQVDVARYLIEQVGVAIHAQAVRAACDNRSLPLFELFLKNGYHPNQQVPSNWGAFGTALKHCLDNDAITCLLLEHGADPNAAPFIDGRLRLWSERAAPPLDMTSGLPLDLAVEQSSFTVIQKLLECGAKPEYSRPLERALNPRLTRTENRRPRDDWRVVMQLVIDYGADPNARSTMGGTPLNMAVHMKRWDVVGFLLERGADPRVKRIPEQYIHGLYNENDAFAAAAHVARIPWKVSGEIRVYLDELCGSGPVGEAPEGALENPLVKFMVEAKNAKGADYKPPDLE